MSDEQTAQTAQSAPQAPETGSFTLPIIPQKAKKIKVAGIPSLAEYLKQASQEPLLASMAIEVENPTATIEPLIKPLAPCSKEFWKALTSKQRWDVLTAMRGPDLKPGCGLKWFTTAVLRLVTRDVLRQDGTSAQINGQIPWVTVSPSGLPSGFMVGFEYKHFAQHVIDAANILKVPVVNVDHWTMMKMMSTGSVGGSVKVLSECDLLPAHYRKYLLQLLAGGF